MEAKKVLILAHKPPYPKADGGCIAIAQMLEAFLDIGVSVHFICFETQKHPSKNVKEHPNLTYKSIPVDTKLSIFEKRNTWVLCSATKIVWVVGHRIDERFKLVENGQKVYLVELIKD